MKKALLIIMSIALLSLLLTGCMREPEVCNYDSICTQDETDNCADCKDVLGRDVVDITGNVIYIDSQV